MKINELYLRNFRNIQEANLSFCNHLNIFYGNNGHGKTNIVESIVYLSSGRSFRVNDEQFLIANHEMFGEIKANIEDIKKQTKLRSVISEQGKFFQVNNQNLNLMSDFIGHCNVVLFNPEDLNFFSTSPRVRRREIDYEIGKMSKDYLQNLSLANKLTKERNAYLKNPHIDVDYLDIITDQLIESSLPVMKIRDNFICKLSPLIEYYYRKISESSASVTLMYHSVLEDEISESNLKKTFEKSLKRDLDFKVTNQGIHREDFVFKIDDVLVSQVASQGQKRMIMISYKLAVIDLYFKKTNEFPIFCMDDLFSELDENKRDRVLSILPKSMQVFITTTDLEFVKTNKKMSVFNVVKGQIYKEENNG